MANRETERAHLFALPDLDEDVVDLGLPVVLQHVEVLVGHLVEVGLGDGVEPLQDVDERGPRVSVVHPAVWKGGKSDDIWKAYFDVEIGRR